MEEFADCGVGDGGFYGGNGKALAFKAEAWLRRSVMKTQRNEGISSRSTLQCFCSMAIAVGVTLAASMRCTAGAVLAWGYNEYGQTDVPPDATNVVAVAGGRDD